MRYLVYLLVIANFALFAWYRLFPSPQPAISYTLATPPAIERLMLLSEREPTVPPEESVASGSESEAPTEIPSTDSSSVPATELHAEAEVEAVSADAAQTAEAEVEAVSADAAQIPEQEAASEAVTEQTEEICQTVGPFLDRKDVTSVFKTLATRGYVVNIRDGDVRQPDGYWVYLPAMSATRARAIVADLDMHGMKDYFVGKQNHISLGIFSNADKARIRQQTVKKLGYDAILDPRYRMRDVFWLDVEQPGKSLLGSALWEEIRAEHADIRIQKVSCE